MSSTLSITAAAVEPESYTINNSIEFESYEKTTNGHNTTGWASAETGSMLGNGSLTMVIALAALVISIVSISLTVSLNKKVSSSTTKTESDEDNE